ncbi:hypothetical protein Rsub_01241 [Raphidocelis subcapitata]|uniref:Thioredoxin domain-containing protein n=1 Tax=Raphidocelis subcapitata TaxID=307507 RepID=A0A2V0NM40_9CHLO|nr:hypothetical protein Rsub_01241 [Raphidocelis subcapitata]|eukprot:GBF88526.1 hypothetical protein Rsub_01241 [Raphidocelis subcapitata]
MAAAAASAAAPGAVPPLQRAVASLDELTSPAYLAGKGLKVIEVFSYAGPCKSVLPVLKRIRLEKDNEAALMFLQVNADSLSQQHQQQPASPTPSGPGARAAAADAAARVQPLLEHAGHCEPLFLFFRNGQLKANDSLEDNPFYAARKEGGGAGKDAAAKSKAKKGGGI